MRTLFLLAAGCWVLSRDEVDRHDLRPAPVPDATSLDVDASQPIPTLAPGTPCSSVTFTEGSGPALDGAGPIGAGDLDGDGVVDLVVADPAAGAITFFAGLGGAAFAAPVVLTLPDACPSALAVGELLTETDGAPRAEAAVLDPCGPRVVVVEVREGRLLEGPSVAISASPVGFAAGFIDEDALLDVAVTTPLGTLDVRIADGDSFRSIAPVDVGGAPAFVSTGAFAPGHLQLVTGDAGSGELRLWAWEETLAGSGFAELTSTAFAGEIAGITGADLDGDGADELLVTDAAGDALAAVPITVREGDSAAFAAEIAVSPTGAGPGKVLAADFADEGCTSAATLGADGVSFLAGLGDGRFAPPVTVPTDGAPFDAVAAQLDGAGPLDLAVVAGDPPRVQLFVGTR